MMWATKSIGVASCRLRGDRMNIIKITIKRKDGGLLYPNELHATRRQLLTRYPEEVINRNGLMGVWIPEKDFELFYEERNA
jgi:hypothetical protein